MKALALNRLTLLLCFAGVFVSGVLSIGQYYRLSLPCGASHGCDLVAQHPSSHALGIPNAYLGLIAYLFLTGLAYWRLVAPSRSRRALVISYAVTALGTLASLILTYVSMAVIQAVCFWCLSSTAIMIALLIINAVMMQLDPDPAGEPNITNGILGAAMALVTIGLLGVEWSAILHGVQPNVDITREITVYLPGNAHIFGDPKAPVTIIEFGDLVCPSCQAEYPKIKDFVNKHPGKVNYIFRHCPLVGMEGHEQAAGAAILAEIADESGKFWQFVDGMYGDHKESLRSFEPILAVAESVGLDPKKAVARVRDKDDPAFKRVMKDLKDASDIGVTGTPMFFLIAKGVKGVRAATLMSLFDELDRPEYKELYGGG